MEDFPINMMTGQIPFIGLIHGLIGVFLFRLNNTNKDWINAISFATIGIFFTEILFFEVTETVGLVTWGISAFGLLFAYAHRFKNKKDKDLIDFLKLIAIGLVACYPINFYSWTMHQKNLDIIIGLCYFIVPISGTIYFYDRWILKPEKMKKKFLITLIVQTIFIIVTMVYAFVQKGIADEYQQRALEQEKIAKQQAIQAAELRVKLENCH